MMEVAIVERPAAAFVGYERTFIQGLSPETNAPEVIGALKRTSKAGTYA